MFDFEEELKKLPDKPGVYIMHGADDVIIYIGKAVVLKNRVRQYFQSSRNKSPKIQKMVSQIERFEYIITDSELEALVLECNLIKEHRPKYNTMLKDDKAYPYIKLTSSEEYPKLVFSRTMKKDKNRYFGPYTSAGAVKDTIELLQKLYKIRTCNRVLPRDVGKERPCLNYHIKQCSAPCQGYISKEEYGLRIKQVLDFFNGNHKEIIKGLKEKMSAASEKMEFEEAMIYRDLIESVKQVSQKQKITNSDFEDRDVIACAMGEEFAIVQIFFVREGKLLGREHYHMKLVADETRAQVLSEFVKQYYGGTPFIPKTIMLQEGIKDGKLIEEWLSAIKQQKVSITTPIKGIKEKFVELAYKNAQIVLNQDMDKIKREYERTSGALNEIAKLLDLEVLSRVEAFDISNISGVESVGSMVVYEDGKPKRNDYRKFKIKWVKGANDYASMYEVLKRRFERAQNADDKFAKYPDLIMMDGGKGQVNIALQVLSELKLNIPVCGMVKDDNHRTRGLYYNNIEIPIDRSSEGFKLITRIQDEAHRFAIEYHRQLRSKTQVKSVLDDIEGIGPVKRKALVKHFLDISAIKEASIEELMQVENISLKNAENIYNFFH
ncbi:MAG: excinuclease ABC subunit UvrC [Lachnospiraceae bacterium]|nr:excinuclease ABC subunit UvrC [Lachnospiraceae bacterium]